MSDVIKRNPLIVVLAAIAAAFAGGASVDYFPSSAELAKLGPVVGGFVIYLEFRIRPLLVKIAGGEATAPATDEPAKVPDPVVDAVMASAYRARAAAKER